MTKEQIQAIDTSKLPIKISYVGKTKRDDWDCYEWRVTITSKSGEWTTSYYCGLGHVIKGKIGEPKPKAPSVDDVLHSLCMDSSAEDQNFADWCAYLGYSDDSIKSLNIYKQCLDIGRALRKHLGRDVVETLRIQLQDH